MVAHLETTMVDIDGGSRYQSDVVGRYPIFYSLCVDLDQGAHCFKGTNCNAGAGSLGHSWVRRGRRSSYRYCNARRLRCWRSPRVNHTGYEAQAASEPTLNRRPQPGRRRQHDCAVSVDSTKMLTSFFSSGLGLKDDNLSGLVCGPSMFLIHPSEMLFTDRKTSSSVLGSWVYKAH